MLRLTKPFFDNAEENAVRDAYKDILPPFVLNRRKLNGRKDYWVIWNKELQTKFPGEHPRCEEDIQRLLNVYVTKLWLESHVKDDSRILEVK